MILKTLTGRKRYMPDVACLGTVNMDIMAYVDEFPGNDSEVIVKKLLYIPSGSAANVAAGAVRLGYSAAVLGAVGTDRFADQIRRKLQEEGIDTSGLVNIEGTSGTIYIPVDKNGNRRIYNSSDAPSKFSKEHLNKELIKSSRFLYMCGIVGDSTMGALDEASSYAKKHGVKIVYDPTIFAYRGVKVQEQLVRNTDILLVNRVEAGALTGEKAQDLLSYCPTVILKLGSEGCMIMTRDTQIKVDGYKVNAIDTTGAGDCFAAALMSKLFENNNIVEAARYANKVAAISVTKEGAMATPTLKEIETFRWH